MIKFTEEVDPNHWKILGHKLKFTLTELHAIKIGNKDSKDCFHALLKILLEKNQEPWTELLEALQAMGKQILYM